MWNLLTAADLTGDNQINGSDLVEEISLVMSQGVSQAPAATAYQAPKSLKTGLVLNDDGCGETSLGVETGNDFVLAQMLLHLSESQHLTDITSDGHHHVEYRQLSENTYFVLCYSTGNAVFSSNDAVLTIHHTGKGTVSVEDAMMVDDNRQEWYFAPAISGDATGIDWVSRMLSSPADIYSIDGYMVRQQTQSLDGLAKGIYIINRNKVIVK